MSHEEEDTKSESTKSEDDRHSSASSKQSSKAGKKKDTVEDREIVRGLDAWESSRRQQKVAQREKRDKEKRQQTSARTWRQQTQKNKQLDELRRRLLESTDSRNEKLLRQTLADVEALEYVEELQEVYEKGKRLLASMDKVKNLPKAKKKLDYRCVSQIRSENRPADDVRKTMKATLILLGAKPAPGENDWDFCRTHCVAYGDKPLLKRIEHFDQSRLDPQLAKQSLKLLKGITREDAYCDKKEVGYFYDWTVGSCEECLLSHDESKPASRKTSSSKKATQSKGQGHGHGHGQGHSQGHGHGHGHSSSHSANPKGDNKRHS